MFRPALYRAALAARPASHAFSAFCHLVGSAAVLIIAAACGPQPVTPLTPLPPSSPSPAHSVSGTPAPIGTATTEPHFAGGSIVIAGIGQPSREVTNLPRFIADALYDSLLQVDPTDGSLKPGFAKDWQVSDDARSLTFHLRAGVLWHDGKPLTAQDVVFTITALSAPDVRMSTPAADFGPLADVTAPDAETVVVRLNSAYCAALTSIGTLKILPEHVLTAAPSTPSNEVAQRGVAALAPDQFVGSGPLVLKSWNPDSLTFSPNVNYWNGAPSISNWTYKIFANAADAQAALRAGQIDLLDLDGGRAISSAPAINVKTIARPANQFYALAINHEREILKDARVRQALAWAIDRPGMAMDLIGKDAQVLQTSLLPGFWATPTNAAQPTYDAARARKLLAEAGWRDTDGDGILDKDGNALSLTLWAVADDPVAEPLAFAIRNMLAQVGFQVLLQLDDRDEMLTRLFLHEFDLAVAPWNIPLDPDQQWYWQSNENKPGEGLNFVSYSNPQVDELLKSGNLAARCDQNTRRAVYGQAYRTISGDVPQVFLFAPPVYVEARTRVFGVEPSSFAGDYWNIISWQVGP